MSYELVIRKPCERRYLNTRHIMQIRSALDSTSMSVTRPLFQSPFLKVTAYQPITNGESSSPHPTSSDKHFGLFRSPDPPPEVSSIGRLCTVISTFNLHQPPATVPPCCSVVTCFRSSRKKSLPFAIWLAVYVVVRVRSLFVCFVLLFPGVVVTYVLRPRVRLRGCLHLFLVVCSSKVSVLEEEMRVSDR